jgi:hypothetical protein
MLQRRSLEEPTPLASRPWFVATRLPVRMAGHHQRAKVPPIPEVVEHAQLMLFPLIR